MVLMRRILIHKEARIWSGEHAIDFHPVKEAASLSSISKFISVFLIAFICVPSLGFPWSQL